MKIKGKEPDDKLLTQMLKTYQVDNNPKISKDQLEDFLLNSLTVGLVPKNHAP